MLQSDEVVTRFADPKMGCLISSRAGSSFTWSPVRTCMFQDEGGYRTAEHLQSLLDQVDAERDQMVRSEASRA